MLQYWYKNAILYNLDVETFQDSNDDGIGDFVGLTQRLDYLAGLGVTCLWLAPFYPTPNRDNGYDVEDYYDVDPRLGDLGDFVDFIRAAGCSRAGSSDPDGISAGLLLAKNGVRVPMRVFG